MSIREWRKWCSSSIDLHPPPSRQCSGGWRKWKTHTEGGGNKYMNYPCVRPGESNMCSNPFSWNWRVHSSFERYQAAYVDKKRGSSGTLFSTKAYKPCMTSNSCPNKGLSQWCSLMTRRPPGLRRRMISFIMICGCLTWWKHIKQNTMSISPSP
jgi:hypothetical protein